MASSLDLRRYRPADHDRVLELHEAAMRAVGAFVEGVPDPDLDDVEAAYLDAGGGFLVGERDGRIVAMGAFRPARGYVTEFLDLPASTAEVKRMRVAPAHWRRGYGRRVYAELERRALDRGFDELVLDTTATQTGAQRFFEAQGFDPVDRERVDPGEEPFELVLYRKSL